jgi:hypothetical protein
MGDRGRAVPFVQSGVSVQIKKEEKKKKKEKKISLFGRLPGHRLFRRCPARCRFCTFPQIPAVFFYIFFCFIHILCAADFARFPTYGLLLFYLHFVFGTQVAADLARFLRVFPKYLIFRCQSCC